MVSAVWIGSPNSRVRLGNVRFITLHWMVGNLRGTDQIFQKVHGTATHYGIENDVVHQYVEESRSAPGTGSNAAIPYDITIEHAGGWLLPDGSRFKPSPATHETSAQLCADISRRHGLGKLVVGVNVFPHKHFVATACPGSLDLEWICNRANELLGNPVAAASVPIVQAVSEETRRVQDRLIELHYDLGPAGADGIRGAYTIGATKQFQRDVGLDDDGIVGPLTTAKLWPPKKTAIVAYPPFPLPKGYYFGPKSGPKQSVSGFYGHRDQLRIWQQRMQDRGWKITADGLYAGETARVALLFQKQKKLKADSLIGPETWTAAWTKPIT